MFDCVQENKMIDDKSMLILVLLVGIKINSVFPSGDRNTIQPPSQSRNRASVLEKWLSLLSQDNNNNNKQSEERCPVLPLVTRHSANLHLCLLFFSTSYLIMFSRCVHSCKITLRQKRIKGPLCTNGQASEIKPNYPRRTFKKSYFALAWSSIQSLISVFITRH